MEEGSPIAKAEPGGWKKYDSTQLTKRIRSGLRRLLTNPRSVFWGMKEAEFHDVLTRCEASIATFGEWSRAGDHEGTLLFRQLRQQKSLYVPLEGAIVFFAPDVKHFREGEPDPPPIELERYHPVPLDYLRKGNRCGRIVGTARAVGILEFVMAYFFERSRRNGELPESLREKEISRRTEALHRLELSPIQNRWLMSGFASNNSSILRIRSDLLLEIVVDSAVERPPDARDDFGRLFMRRCQQELAFRETQQLKLRAMMARGLQDHVLAWFVYDHYFRKRGKNRNRIVGSRERIAWYVGLVDTNLVPKVLAACEQASLTRSSQTSSVFTFDPVRLRVFHHDWLPPEEHQT